MSVVLISSSFAANHRVVAHHIQWDLLLASKLCRKASITQPCALKPRMVVAPSIISLSMAKIGDLVTASILFSSRDERMKYSRI